MKRSEMVKKLEDLISEQDSEEYYSPKSRALQILEMIEYAGMYPPLCNISGYTNFDSLTWEEENV